MHPHGPLDDNSIAFRNIILVAFPFFNLSISSGAVGCLGIEAASDDPV
jgi:hypothetical protein